MSDSPAGVRALESGNEVAFDVIARRAGVGNATLYRHFPTRADLLVAVYDRRTSLFHQWHASITSTAARLMQHAQPALRSDLTATDVLALATGAALTTDIPHARRLVALLRTGIAVEPDGATDG